MFQGWVQQKEFLGMEIHIEETKQKINKMIFIIECEALRTQLLDTDSSSEEV